MVKNSRVPIAIFVLSLAFVAAGSALSLWIVEKKADLSVKIKELSSIQVEHMNRLGDLAAQIPAPQIVYREQVTGQYPEFVCSSDGLVPKCITRWHQIKTQVPEVTSASVDPSLLQKIQAQEATIRDTTAKLQELNSKVKSVDSPVGINKEYIRVAISLIVLLSNLFVVLSRKYGPQSEKWAFGGVGTILGYWLG